MNRKLSNDDLIFLRKNHFLSKNLFIYLNSIININENPVPFSYDKTIGIRHRLKRKIQASRIFLEVCKELQIIKNPIELINYEIIGDSQNFRKFLKEFNTIELFNLRDPEEDPFHISNKKFQADFYFKKKFYKITFKFIFKDELIWPDQIEDATKIIFIPGQDYNLEHLRIDLEFLDLRDIPAIVILFQISQKNVHDNIFEEFKLKSILFNEEFLQREENLEILFL